MAQYDSAIILHAKLDGKTAESDLKQFRVMVDATGKEIAAMGQRIDKLKNEKDVKLVKQLEKAREAAKAASDEMDALGQKADAAVAKNAESIRNEYLRARATPEDADRIAKRNALDRTMNANPQLFKDLDAATQKYNECEAAVRRLEQEMQEEDAKRQREIASLQKQRAALEENLAAMNKSLAAKKKLAAAADAVAKFSERVKGLAERVFVFTVITSALRNMRTWLGSVIQTNDEARTAMARLQGALLTLAQPLVQVVIPAFTAFINVLTAVITRIAEFVSLLFGTTLGKSAQAAGALNKQTKALGGVSGAAKEAAKSLADFDEIHVLDTGTGDAVGGGGANVGEIEPDFSFVEGVSERLKEIADLVLLIGAGFALWAIGSSLPGVLGTIASTIGLIAIAVGSLLLFWDGLADAWENGVDWGNLIEMLAGVAGAAFALYNLLSPLAAGIALVVGGLAMLVTGFHDAMENGWNLQNALLSIAGLVGAGLGLTFITGSVIPAVIGGIAALLLALTVATGHGDELIAGIQQTLEGFKDFFTGIFTGDLDLAIQGIAGIFDGLGVAIGAVIDGVKDAFLAFLDWLDEKTGGKLTPIINFMKDLFSTTFDAIKTTVEDVIDALEEILTGIVEFISVVFTLDFDRALQGVKDIFKGVWNGVVSILEGALNLIIDGVNWLINQLNKLHVDIPGFLGGGSIGINIPAIESVSLPRLAQGAVIPPNREFLAVLGDQTSGTNVESPASLIKQMVMEALAETGALNGGDIHVHIDGDIAPLIRLLRVEIERENKRVGPGLIGGVRA